VVIGLRKGKVKKLKIVQMQKNMWVWMRPHIGFCTIGKCDLLSFFLSFNRISPSSLQISSSFSSILLKHGAFHMRFHFFCFLILAPFFLFFFF
jgi:hypothetical protein